MRLIRRYLIAVGLLAHLVPVLGVVFVLKHYQLSVDQLVIKTLQKTGMDTGWVEAVLAPSPRHTEFVLDGTIRAGHPRLFPRETAWWHSPAARGRGAGALDLYREAGLRAPQALLHCAAPSAVLLAICYDFTGDRGAAERGVSRLADEVRALTIPENALSVGRSTGHWQLALAYDLLFAYDGFAPDRKAAIEATVARGVARYLSFLDGDELSLWHSRSSVAAEAWFMAAVLDQGNPDYADLTRRAQAYFLDAIDGLALTEAWPGGYNYWINNRALLFALGAAAYLNATENAAQADRVRRTVLSAALWSVYASRPDRRVEGLGDEGPRVDQKDETRRAIDLVAQLTRNPVLATYSRYLETLYGDESYYSGYRWAFPILNDPTVRPFAAEPAGDIATLGGRIPGARLFGRGALNLGFIRSGWGPDDTMISLRAGANLSHHGHYDAGHFTLFKGAPLAVNASRYYEVFDRLRLDFAIRTVAKNSILILRPGEDVTPNRFFPESIAAGGQRITMPTGSAIRDVSAWRDNLFRGLHLEAGTVAGWRHEEGGFTYAATDIGAAYNRPDFDAGGSGGKAEAVTRELLYLRAEDLLLVRDRVVSVEPGYAKKWLLHTVNRPRLDGLRVLRGGESDGILESRADTAFVENGPGRLVVQRLAPAEAIVRLVGGPNHRFYVETDGDDGELDGRTIDGANADRPWFDPSAWRIEIRPAEAEKRADFLVALLPSTGSFRTDRVTPVPMLAGRGVAVATADSVVVFAEPGDRELRFRIPGNQRRIYVLGVADGTPVRASQPSGATFGRALAEERMAVLTSLLETGAEAVISIGGL
jgi:hypothetical protein